MIPLKKYRVMVEGANFLITFDNETAKYGFYTTRFLEAENEDDAEVNAMDILREELADIVQNDLADSPVMFLAEIEELRSFADYPVPGTGFVWFPDEKGH